MELPLAEAPGRRRPPRLPALDRERRVRHCRAPASPPGSHVIADEAELGKAEVRGQDDGVVPVAANDVSPSTSSIASPASATAARIASRASPCSLRW